MKLQGREPRLIVPAMSGHSRRARRAIRPMRFVEVKNEAAQARCMLFRVRDRFVRQRRQTVNAIYGSFAEFRRAAPVGRQNVSRLAAIAADKATSLPALARDLREDMLERRNAFSERLAHLDRRINEGATQTPDGPYRVQGRSRLLPSAASSRRRNSSDLTGTLLHGSGWWPPEFGRRRVTDAAPADGVAGGGSCALVRGELVGRAARQAGWSWHHRRPARTFPVPGNGRAGRPIP